MEKDKIYSILAVFQYMIAEEIYTLQEICDVVEKATGKTFSTEILEKRIQDLRITLAGKDKNELNMLLQNFLYRVRDHEQDNSTC